MVIAGLVAAIQFSAHCGIAGALDDGNPGLRQARQMPAIGTHYTVLSLSKHASAGLIRPSTGSGPGCVCL
jgi:hypothetical protein